MNKIIVSLLFVFTAISVNAQFEIGLKAGVNSSTLANEPIIYNGNDQSIELAFQEADYGFHIGLYSRLKLAAIYIEPAFMINSSKVNYQITEFVGDEIFNSVKTENYTNLDIPVLLGLKLGVLRIAAGPVAHINLDSNSELFEIKGYSQKFKEATYGYQVGAGLDLWKIRLDVAYEGNFSNFGDHIAIDGNELAFDDSLSRLLFTLGWKF